jgi:hypothetical protein
MEGQGRMLTEEEYEELIRLRDLLNNRGEFMGNFGNNQRKYLKKLMSEG